MTVSEWFAANKPKTLNVLLKVKCPDGQVRTICLADFIFHWKVTPDSIHNWEVIEEVKDHRHD